MLVLSRKQREAITVGNDVTIRVLAVRGGTVKLGIDAPSHVRILRAEIPNWDDEHSADEQYALHGARDWTA